MTNWPIVPISQNQMADVRPEDLRHGNLFRVCDTARGGGGYDHFAQIACDRHMVTHPNDARIHFIAQLYGCPLDCPYCYVTRAGVWGTPKMYDTKELVYLYRMAEGRANVFHLMGGAPGMFMEHWPELIKELKVRGDLFHSDLMLCEKKYYPEVLKQFNESNVLLAVNIKGTTPIEWFTNTRKRLDEKLFEYNLRMLNKYVAWDRWYITFTNVPVQRQDDFIKKHDLWGQHYYGIDLIDYEALPLVDSVPWGRRA